MGAARPACKRRLLGPRREAAAPGPQPIEGLLATCKSNLLKYWKNMQWKSSAGEQKASGWPRGAVEKPDHRRQLTALLSLCLAQHKRTSDNLFLINNTKL
ncbi:Hypothetical predicted protein [Podarcis lilfordi]|uniref:Uncharacterized protein n=1 Tax=Podarcis lilfordi TaxID=74358 RepID=A0AA35P1I8_9SAUR|nr:Hypothetical predicted protein [Podarcis lilfordi]